MIDALKAGIAPLCCESTARASRDFRTVSGTGLAKLRERACPPGLAEIHAHLPPPARPQKLFLHHAVVVYYNH